jgi:hippurate hydrolase
MRLAGTIRCFDPGLCDIVSRRLQDFGRHIAMLHGCEIDVDIDWEASPLVNSAEHVDIAIAAARSVAGAAAVTTDIALSMGAEDFADMLSAKPGAYMIMGNAGEATATRAPLHTASCDFNDEAIPLGIAYWVALATARRS